MVLEIFELTGFLTKTLVQKDVTTICCDIYGTANETHLHAEEENLY